MVNEEQPTPLELSGQQQALYEALSEKGQTEKGQRLAVMYLGALTVLGHTSNPDRLALAAHDLRELMEKIPAFVDVQIKAHQESLKAKIRELEDCWQATLQNTTCYSNQTWNGQIDRSLSKLLGRLHTFFKWFVEHHPRRKVEIVATLRELYVSRHSLPMPLEELNVQAWDEMRNFFQAVSHHRKLTTTEEFDQWLDALERFLLDRLRPRTFADFDIIDQIIREGESDA